MPELGKEKLEIKKEAEKVPTLAEYKEKCSEIIESSKEALKKEQMLLLPDWMILGIAMSIDKNKHLLDKYDKIIEGLERKPEQELTPEEKTALESHREWKEGGERFSKAIAVAEWLSKKTPKDIGKIEKAAEK